MVTLSGVSETLLISLYARALETERVDAIIRDPKAVGILEILAPDVSKFRNMRSTQIGTAVRTEIIDEATSDFIESLADPVVVELGAGLSTRPFRLGEERAEWIAVDLPDVEPVWRDLIAETSRRRFVGRSVLEPEWTDALEGVLPHRTLFIAEGLLMYFEPSAVRTLITGLATMFPGAEFIFDALGPILGATARLHPAVSKTSAAFRWGTRNVSEMERWHPSIRVIRQWGYLDRHRKRWGRLRLLPFLKSELKVAQLRFAPTGDRDQRAAHRS